MREEHRLLAGAVLAALGLAVVLVWGLEGAQAEVQDEGPSKVASVGPVEHGDVVTYTILVEGLGVPPTATAHLTDVVPVDLSYIPGTLTATAGVVTDTDAPALRWSGALTPGPVVTVTYVVSVSTTSPRLVTNTAVIVTEGRPAHTCTAGIVANPYTAYLPLVTRIRYTASYSAYAAGSWHMLGKGVDLADSLLAADYLWRYDYAFSGENYPPDPMRPSYQIKRSYVTFDLSGAPPGEILSATLELYTLMDVNIRGAPEVYFHLGGWTPAPTKADWDDYGALLGTYDTGDRQPGQERIWVGLPGLVGRPVPAHLDLVVRGDEVTQLPYGAEAIVAAFDLYEPCGDHSPLSRLHLQIGVAP